MTNINVLENKISSIKKYLGILKTYQSHAVEKITADPTLKGAIERYLYLATQSTIELGEAFISLKHFRKPTVYSETFEILKENGIITVGLTEKLIRMTGFRNAIAHDYEKVDLNIAYDVLHNRLVDIEDFIELIEKHI